MQDWRGLRAWFDAVARIIVVANKKAGSPRPFRMRNDLLVLMLRFGCLLSF